MALSLTQPISASVVVIGLGVIGGALLQALPAAIGWDPDPETVAHAAAAGYLTATTLQAALAPAHIVIIAVPPQVTAAVVAQVLVANREAIVVDVCSTKSQIVTAVLHAQPERCARYVPAHPLVGAATQGWQTGQGTFFTDAPWAVCPHPQLDPEVLWQTIELISGLDGCVVGCMAAEHDEIIAYASHLLPLVAASLADLAPSSIAPTVAALHGGGLRDMTRIAQASPALWQAIIMQNGSATLAALEQLIVRLQALRSALAEQDWPAIGQVMERGNLAQARMAATRWNPGDWQTAVWPLGQLSQQLLHTGRHGQAVQAISRTDDRLQVRCRLPQIIS